MSDQVGPQDGLRQRTQPAAEPAHNPFLDTDDEHVGDSAGSSAAPGDDAASSATPAPAPSTSAPVPDDDEAESAFECNICLDTADEPVITVCGHLFCWPCIYRWLEQATEQSCPVCKAGVSVDKLIPLYGRGKAQTSDPRTRPPAPDIPNRPAGQRSEPERRQGMFGGQVGGAQWTFSAGLGPFPSLVGLQFQQFPMDGFRVHNNGAQNDLSAEQIHQQQLSRVFMMLGWVVIMCLLFY